MPAPPPIPEHLAHRPTRNGLVVPYISMTTADGTALLGQTRAKPVGLCIVNYWCQICGRPLDRSRPLLFLVTQQILDEAFSSEPPLHPECAAYTVKACPMVAGRAFGISTLADGTTWTLEQAAAAGQCLWHLTGRTWTPSCPETASTT